MFRFFLGLGFLGAAGPGVHCQRQSCAGSGKHMYASSSFITTRYCSQGFAHLPGFFDSGANAALRIAPKEQPEHRPHPRTPGDDAAMGGSSGQAKPLCTSELNPPASTAEDSATYSFFTFHLPTMHYEFAEEEQLFLLDIPPESIHLFRKERGVFLTGRAHFVLRLKCVPKIF